MKTRAMATESFRVMTRYDDGFPAVLVLVRVTVNKQKPSGL